MRENRCTVLIECNRKANKPLPMEGMLIQNPGKIQYYLIVNYQKDWSFRNLYSTFA
jgi:hypothetical protein